MEEHAADAHGCAREPHRRDDALVARHRTERQATAARDGAVDVHDGDDPRGPERGRNERASRSQPRLRGAQAGATRSLAQALRNLVLVRDAVGQARDERLVPRVRGAVGILERARASSTRRPSLTARTTSR